MKKANEIKKQLAYSRLTNNIYWIDGKGQKTDVTQNFIQNMLLWINEGELPKVGEAYKRALAVNGKVMWEISCKRISE